MSNSVQSKNLVLFYYYYDLFTVFIKEVNLVVVISAKSTEQTYLFS